MSLHKTGLLSRADLLLAVADENEESQQILAQALQLKRLGFTGPIGKKRSTQATGQMVAADVAVSKQGGASEVRLHNPSPTARLRSTYWQLLAQKNREDEVHPAERQEAVFERPQWKNKPKQRPPFPALMSETAMQQRLLPCLRREKLTHRIDIARLTKQASRAEFITELPLQRLRRDTQAVQIIDDRQVHLMPYWLDHSWLTWHVMGQMAEYRLSRAVIEQGETGPQSIVQQELTDYQSPPEGSTLLLLSDLGVLAGRLPAYKSLLHQWLKQGYHIVVVTPCHMSDYPAALSAQVTLLSWEAQCSALPQKAAADSDTPCPRQQWTEKWVEKLLVLCSAAVRLEPELLRSVRYALNQHLLKLGEPVLPAAAESLVWQHSAVTQKHSVAATVDAQQNQQWQTALKRESFALKNAVFAALRSWRVTLPDEIWFGEFLLVDRCFTAEDTKPDWFQRDSDEARNFFNYLHQQVLSGEQGTAQQSAQTKAWLQRMALRISADVVSEGALSEQIQLCLHTARDANGEIPGGHVVDPTLKRLDKRDTVLPKQSAWLCQRGHQLVITQHDTFTIPKQRSSLIARLDYRQRQLNTHQDGKSFQVELPEQLNDEFVPLAGTDTLTAEAMRLQTDLTELHLAGFERPAWAKRVGRDAYGLFAELALPNKAGKELLQCFRWIPVGTFMMGSPESEPERYEDEDYHQVTLSRGYWLADTTVTQAVWLAVMGDNPADFQEDLNNPVEQVSWNDAQQFIRQVNKDLNSTTDDYVLRLPTEAEWEYACRAGTTTPFSFGENVTSGQVNFDGSRPYRKGKKSEDRNETIAVKSLPPNQWGLYEMHGNVWEWCMDAWQEHSGVQSMVDPYHSDDSGASCVFRGGSWLNDGRSVRSASRDHYSPDGRDHDIGLRLALGHELKARSAKDKK